MSYGFSKDISAKGFTFGPAYHTQNDIINVTFPLQPLASQ